FPLLLSRLMDHYFQTGGFNWSLIWILLGVALVGMVAIFASSFVFGFLGERFGWYLRGRLMKKVIRQPQRYFIKNKPAKVLTVLSGDVNFVRNVFGQLAGMIFMTAILLVGSLGLMFSIDLGLTLIISTLVIGVMVFLLSLFKKVKKLFKKNRKLRDRFNKVIDENVRAAMLIRVYTAQRREERKFTQTNIQSRKVGIQTNNLMAFMMPSIHFINLFSSLLIVVIGGRLVMGGEMTYGSLTIFSNYVMMFTMSMIMIVMLGGMIGQAMVSLGRISEVLSGKNEFENGQRRVGALESIELRRVGLEIEGRQVLKEVDFKIKKGERVALVGLTGSGKSLVLELLTRILDPTSGEILVNGRLMAEYDVRDLRHRVGVAFQDGFLLDASLFQNIDFGRRLKKSEVEWASKVALVDEFSSQFKQGLDYRVGEYGRRLSGGQKQRVNIARAIAGRPQLIILDDVTSSLDVATENKIIANLEKEVGGAAVVLVSQKIAAIKNADRIYVLENGEVVDVGTHHQLSERCVLYREIELTQKNYGQE
ncbi:ABC transporter ATP-binding protein/permease, partial [Patescibacteria group bacterium]|nr:ABC transporter ATP-binding protein/permease [Patescibacteria group bacterium]